LDPQPDKTATATRVHAAILERVMEEWAERIQCFLLVEKRTKPIRGTVVSGLDRPFKKCNTSRVVRRFLLHGFGFIADFWENPDILSRVYV
jgi:hypothetical protein